MIRRSQVVAAALGAGLTFCCALASAQTMQDDQAKIQFQQGIELYEEGKFEQAAVAFETAYELKPSYRILFNIAQAENELGHYAAALMAYTRYLADGGDEVPPDRLEQVKREVQRLNALVGMIVVDCAVDGATVFVDGKRQGETPLSGPVFADLGDREVVLKEGSDELHREVVRVQGGMRTELKIAAKSAPPDLEAAEEAPERTPGEPGVEEEEPEGGRVWTWVAFGVGGASAIGMAIAGGIAMSRTSEIEDACGGTVCTSDHQGEIDSANSAATAADVLLGIAAAGIVAGAVLLFTEPVEEETATVSPTVSRDGAGLAIQGRF